MKERDEVEEISVSENFMPILRKRFVWVIAGIVLVIWAMYRLHDAVAIHGYSMPDATLVEFPRHSLGKVYSLRSGVLPVPIGVIEDEELAHTSLLSTKSQSLSERSRYNLVAFAEHGKATIEPTTEVLSLAAQNYLFLASGTTAVIVCVPLVGNTDGQQSRWLLTDTYEICVYTRLYIWWPQKQLTKKEEERIRDLYLQAFDAIVPSFQKRGGWEDHTLSLIVHRLCEPLMPERFRSYQLLPLNQEFLAQLSKEFPEGPRPLGVYMHLSRGGSIYR